MRREREGEREWEGVERVRREGRDERGGVRGKGVRGKGEGEG